MVAIIKRGGVFYTDTEVTFLNFMGLENSRKVVDAMIRLLRDRLEPLRSL